MRRFVAAAAVVALAGLGCAACDNGSTPASSGTGAAAPGDLSGVQSTLQSIENDMAGDGSK
ncbi:hypothetical protein [Amycolatopsis benzoatilytica]|uniref:hypothetical protein n=1 Tax=Amycolatopsis benzoatilytica TaxID=346045 RepID=UPI00035DEACC|nr:hypothetical protein [Amycolatopsis benzoatilytica]